MIKINYKNISDIDSTLISEGPAKSDSSNAKDSFIQESIYQNFIEQLAGVEDVMIDTLDVLPFFGRVNKDLLSIIPNEELKEFTISDSPVSVLSFVADAYKFFISDLEIFKQKGIIKKNSIVYNFKSIKDIQDLDSLYNDYLETEFSSLIQFVDQNSLDKEILDFESFIKVFLAFIDVRTPSICINKSTFVYSKYCTPKMNGLIIDLSDQKINNQKNIYNKMINDVSFKCYLKVAKDNGFYVNKNAPWQLIANLDSDRMKYYFKLRMDHYVKNKNIRNNPISTSSNKFDECKAELSNFNLKSYLFNSDIFYKIVNYEDINNLKLFIGSAYNSYIKYRPIIKKNVYNNKKLETEIVERNIVLLDKLLKQEPTNYWFRVYAYCKCREANSNFSQTDFDLFAQKIYNLYSTLDKKSYLLYTQEQLNKVKNTKRKNRNFVF